VGIGLQPFVAKLQRAVSVEESGWDKIFATSIGIGLLNNIFGAASLFKINIVRFVLKGIVEGWELPEYKEIVLG
jgi:hypothetical protein